MEDLAVVNGRDESICDGLDGLVEIWLGGENVDGSLWGQRGVSWDDCGGERVEGDQQDGRLRRRSSGRFVRRVDRVIGHGRSGSVREGSGDFEVKIAVGMEFQL